jgi:hypothetical protein
MERQSRALRYSLMTQRGLIERIELYHRPLAIVLSFANELEHTLGDTLGAKLFARARQFS